MKYYNIIPYDWVKVLFQAAAVNITAQYSGCRSGEGAQLNKLKSYTDELGALSLSITNNQPKVPV